MPSPSPSPSRSLGLFCMAAAVLCFVTTGACDHLDCHRGPFLVVVVVVDDPQAMDSYLCTYSSESATWSKRVSPGFIRCTERMPSVCGECTLFWVCIVRQCSSMICNQDKSLGWNSQLDACVVSQECSPLKHGYGKVHAYPVSGTYPIRIRAGYGQDTYPRRIRVSQFSWA